MNAPQSCVLAHKHNNNTHHCNHRADTHTLKALHYNNTINTGTITHTSRRATPRGCQQCISARLSHTHTGMSEEGPDDNEHEEVGGGSSNARYGKASDHLPPSILCVCSRWPGEGERPFYSPRSSRSLCLASPFTLARVCVAETVRVVL